MHDLLQRYICHDKFVKTPPKPPTNRQCSFNGQCGVIQDMIILYPNKDFFSIYHKETSRIEKLSSLISIVDFKDKNCSNSITFFF